MVIIKIIKVLIILSNYEYLHAKIFLDLNAKMPKTNLGNYFLDRNFFLTLNVFYKLVTLCPTNFFNTFMFVSIANSSLGKCG